VEDHKRRSDTARLNAAGEKMRTLALLAIAASVAGCEQIPKNANDLKNLPPEKLAKADFIAPVGARTI
jgi:hypothetical protein